MEDEKKRKSWISRLRILILIIVFLSLVLTGRLAYLQIYKHEYYVQQAENNRLRPLITEASRGEIIDCNGEVLVTNRPGFAISLLDQGSGYDDPTIEKLSELLHIEVSEINNKIRQQNYRRYIPVRLKEDVDYSTLAIVMEHMAELQGVIIETLPVRNYVKGNFAAHILGYLNENPPSENTVAEWAEQGYEYEVGDRVGDTGLEKVWEAYLRGEDGEVQVLVNSLGQPISYLQRQDPVPGDTLRLTLDSRLQQKAEELLEQRITEIRDESGIEVIRSGTLVALNPNTGAIMAMVSYPGYDPNTFSQDYSQLVSDPADPLINKAISSGYPIGSAFKPLTALAALQDEKIDDNDRVRCGGVMHLDGGLTKHCMGVHGNINIYQALQKSCNIYFYTIGAKTGIDRLEYYARQFSFGSTTGLVDIPGEISGRVASREEKAKVSQYPWYPGETMDAAIGQGYHSITPIQLANFTAMLANGGSHYRPYLVDSIISADGNVTKIEPELLGTTDISPENFEIVAEGMSLVSSPGGTAGFLSSFPVKVNAKTGTAETGKKYEGKDLSHTSFICYMPANDPEIAVAALIEYAGGEGSASRLTGDFLSYYLELQE